MKNKLSASASMTPLLAGIFALSLAALTLEIVLARIFSVLFSYHYVFMVVSMALLGLSAGAVYEYLRGRAGVRRDRPPLEIWGACAAGSICATIFLIELVGAWAHLLLLVGIALPPFFFVGATLSGVFRWLPEKIAPLYAADLIGAAFGCFGALWGLDSLGGPATILAAATVAAAAALFFGLRCSDGSAKWGSAACLLTGLLLLLDLFLGVAGPVPIRDDPDKELFQKISDVSIGGEIVESRWSSFGRSDLVRYRKYPGSMGMYIDGAAGTSMYRWDGRLPVNIDRETLLSQPFPGVFPFAFMGSQQKRSALIIGPGGGRDVLATLMAGVKQIVAVEVNPDFVALVREHEAYNGRIYTGFEQVEVVIDEGRSFLQRSEKTYDAIMLALPSTKSARAEGHALAEQFLYTREAFKEYLEHLGKDGSLILVAHHHTEALKLVATAVAVLNGLGQSTTEAMRHIYYVDHEELPTVVVRKDPLDQGTAAAMVPYLKPGGPFGQKPFVPLPANGRNEQLAQMEPTLLALARGSTRLDELVARAPADLVPATDNQPFFSKFERGLPIVLQEILVLATILLAVVLVAPAIHRRRSPANPNSGRWTFPLLFLGLGTGFMLIELSLFQKLVLYLGHPTFALALLLSSLLVGGGLGSMVSGTIHTPSLPSALTRTCLAIAAAVILSSLVLDSVLTRLQPLDGLPAVVAALGIGGLGVLMGVPFPSAIRLMFHAGLTSEIPWMWGINGAASVFGSVLAMVLAVWAGYGMVLLVGALMYVAVGLIGCILKPSRT